ncbi:MAG: ubiquinone/menaquinone biosynthesis C-methylase UbiE [Gammaproteobacteria bacterium]
MRTEDFRPQVTQRLFKQQIETPDMIDTFTSHAEAICNTVNGGDEFRAQLIHVNQFKDQDYIASYDATIVNAVLGELRDTDKLIMDFGCWSGITSLYLAEATRARVVGVDINPSSIEFANRYIPTDSIRFVQSTPDRIPYPSNQVDLIVVNQVFCNMRRSQWEVMLTEMVRILNNTGRIIIVESNNPDNLDVVTNLKLLYDRLEGPDGSYLLARQKFIDELLPQTAPNKEHAANTCYKTSEEIMKYLDKLKSDEPSAASHYDANGLEVPVSPRSPGAPSSPTPPQTFIRNLTKYGMSCTVSASYPPIGELVDEAGFYIVARN